MEFNPNNPIIRLCVEGMDLEAKGQPKEAAAIFMRAWNASTNDFEKFISAYYVARHQQNSTDHLKWLEIALQLASDVEGESAKSALPNLYFNIAKCYEELNAPSNAKKYSAIAETLKERPTDTGPFYHGTKADLQIGDLLLPGGQSNYKADFKMNHLYFTAVANGAGLAAALAKGEGRERVYIVEPTASFENDPNVTDKKFPGNPTRSFRTSSPMKIVGELNDWVRQTPEQIQMWKERLAKSKGDIIN